VLLKSGLLPGGAQALATGDEQVPEATLTWNDNGKYTAVWVKLRTMSAKNVFLKDIAEIDLPVAHAEGRLVVHDKAVLDRWRKNSQIALCYQAPCDGARQRAADGETLPFPANPNGSVANIAGLSDPSGRILGLMPHPERFIHATQHPHWTRRRMTGDGAGMQIFRNAVGYFG
jgi:phosphoribosylformylglycinamidine synthase